MSRKLMFIAALFTAMVVGVPTVRAVPLSWDGHYYEAIDMHGGYTWDYANADASTHYFNGSQGHLVTMTRQAEYSFVKSVFDAAGWTWGICWIGATQAGNGTASWVNGEGPVSISGWTQSPWGGGQPGTGNYGVDMTGSGYSYVWQARQAAFNGIGGYIIEYDAGAGPSSVPELPTWLFLSAGLAGLVLLRKQATVASTPHPPGP